WLIKCIGDPVFCAPNLANGGSLGSAYAPLFVGTALNNPSRPGFQAPDVFAVAETPERMRGRRRLLDGLERALGTKEGHHALGQWQEVHRQGFELAMAPGPRQAFEVDREALTERDRYG